MMLATFLLTHTPVTSVQLLPDNRLINVVVGNGELYGVVVDDIPVDATLTEVSAVLSETTITTANGLTFDTTQYVMLGSPET